MNDPSDFILVFYKSLQCGHCTELQKIWEDLSNIHKPTVSKVVKKAYPNIKIITVEARDNFGNFVDSKKYPKGLQFFNAWFPMVLMIPYKLWKEAMSNLSKNPPVNLTPGTFILNGVIENNTIAQKLEYNHMNVDDILKWVTSVVQSKSKEMAMGNTSNDIPKRIFSKEGILPTEIKINPIIKPIESSKVIEKEEKGKKILDNVCFMNIVARPS